MYRRTCVARLRDTTYGFVASMSMDRVSTRKPSSHTAAPSNLFERSRRVRARLQKEPSYAQRADGALSRAHDASAVHLYANKESAWSGDVNDRYYGARRFREYWRTLWRERSAFYYVLGMFILLIASTAKLYHMQSRIVQNEGLIGPKRRHYRSRLTVVLDLDETLVSYGDKAYRMNAGMVPRPYLAELLDYLSTIDAEVIVWAACSERYMRQALKVMDPTGTRISHYITRSKDWFTNDNFYEKNIAWLKRPMEDTIIIENRSLSVRNCNANALLVDDFIRAEYMDTGQDYPINDHALRTVRQVIEDLETTGMAVPDYLASAQTRGRDIKAIPCHLAMRQLPDEIARGVFYFVGNKYSPSAVNASHVAKQRAEPTPTS